MSLTPAYGWRNDTHYPLNWPEWLVEQQRVGLVKVDRVFTTWNGSIVTRDKTHHVWSFYNELGDPVAHSKTIHEDLLPLAWLKEVAPKLFETEEPNPTLPEEPPMARKKAEESEGEGSTQLALVPMTQQEYEHAAQKFADLKIRHKALKAKRKKSMKDQQEAIDELDGEMQGLAESIQAYEAK